MARNQCDDGLSSRRSRAPGEDCDRQRGGSCMCVLAFFKDWQHDRSFCEAMLPRRQCSFSESVECERRPLFRSCHSREVLVVVVADAGVVLFSPSISPPILSKSHSAFPRSRLTPTPWPSQSQRQRQPQSKPLLRRRKTTMTLPAVAQAGSMRAPRQTRPLPRSERPTISLVVAAPARGGQWQTTISPRAVRIRPLQSGLLRQKARAKKSSYPDLSTSSRGILHCFPPEWQRKKWQ